MNLTNKLMYKIKDKENSLILSNIIMSFLLKGGSLFVSLSCTKQYIVYFDNNIILGSWFAIVSILNWILYFDLGIGNGLRNGIVMPIERNDYGAIKRYISTGYVTVGIISLSIIIVGLMFSYFIDWNKFLNLPKELIDEKTLFFMISIVIIGVGVQFFLKVIVSIYQAMRKTAIFGWTTLMTNLILLTYLKFSTIKGKREQLLIYAFIYIVATNLPILLVSVFSFCGKFKKSRPNVRYFDKNIAKDIMKLGIKFFVIQVALLVISSSDSWLITYFFRPEDTVSYQIYYRFFSIALTVYALFSQTAWSSVTKYAGEKNGEKIKKIYIFLNIVAILGGISCFILATVFQEVVYIWMGNVYKEISLQVALLFAAWMMIQMLVNSSTAIANGTGSLKCQAILIPIAGIIKIVGVVTLSYLGKGWAVVLVCNIVSLIPLAIFQHVENIKKIKNINYK